MKRSDLNRIIDNAIDFLEKRGMPLPPFAYWGLKEWQEAGIEYEEIVDNMLGWDVTDFGSGDFENIGLTIFTFRNGNFYNTDKYPKPYAEKMLLVGDGQILPYHYHWSKMEDIINRGGGDLRMKMYNSVPEDFADVEGGRAGKPGTFDMESDVVTKIDGKTVVVPAGSEIVLKPGQSITIFRGQYHTWQGVPGTGPVMLFEVSTSNDDNIDNRFYEKTGRIPAVEEDEEIRHLMFADYPTYYKAK
ncbi:MAG: D-lyxose/D-mannose family sugar isomerase [Eubacteriales bacterium]|nr:D-lyxose/D-mannose family sugar isomerase [Eubacteriales bacterium]